MTMSFVDELFSLEDQVAVVLGGTGVLGGAIAEGLARAGARVMVVGRNEQRGRQRVQRIMEAGGQARFGQADVLVSSDLARLRDRLLDEWGGIDILVNGAGGNDPAATTSADLSFQEIPLRNWNKVFDLNLVGGTLLPCQVIGGAMLQRQSGSIINVASMSGGIPLSRVVAYSAAKAAVINLTKFLAREWASCNVRVNAISPGFFPAEQNRALLYNDDGTYSQRGEQVIGHTMMRRFGDPAELVGCAIWLASHKASSFVTGCEIRVDGGFSSMTI